MTYELIQATLTNLISFTTIAGFGGIIAHHLYKQHQHWVTTYCPALAPYTPDTQVEETKVDTTLESPDIPTLTAQPQPEQPAITDPWEGESETHIKQTQRLSVRHFSPILTLPAAQETPAQVKTPAKRGRKPKAQPQPMLAEELGLTPPSDWGKVQQPKKVNHKAKSSRKRQTA